MTYLNYAAILILRIGKYDPISAAIRRDLHWLPFQFRIQYKLNSITSNCLAGRAPEYLIEFCRSVNDNPARRNLRSSSQVSAPGPSISEGTIRSKRFLRLLTTAVEFTSCRHPTSPQRTSTFQEDLKLTICNSSFYAKTDLCHQCDLNYYYYSHYYYYYSHYYY